MVFDFKEVLKYCSELMITEKPDWITCHEVVHEDLAYRLLEFNAEGKKDGTPVFIIPL